jgi:hypothetical protein
MGDFANWTPPQPLLRREVPCAIPPSHFTEGICCLASIMGEVLGSGRVLGLDVMAKKREI